MRYALHKKLVPLNEGDEPAENGVLVEVIGPEEYDQRYRGHLHHGMVMKSFSHIRYCKADVLPDCVAGTFLVPDKENPMENALAFGYYMNRRHLLFVCEDDPVKDILEELREITYLEESLIAHLFFELMEHLIKDDVIFLHDYEARLEQKEEDLLAGRMTDLRQDVMVYRRELLRIDSYYDQLVELSEVLEENENHLFTPEDCRLFGLYANRVSRLKNNVFTLREYAMQLRELYQSQLAVRQNNIMQFLTIVTTIFMPLTLVAGWYGMNFVNMPELRWPHSYLVVIFASVALILIEIWYFKKKNWFQ